MQNSGHNNMEDKFAMNFGAFDTDSLFNSAHMGGLNLGMKRTAHEAGLDRENMGLSSDEDDHIKKEDRIIHPPSSSRENVIHHHQTAIEEQQQHHTQKTVLPNGKKTKGRVKIKMEFIDNKLRRYTTFSKRKTGIMKKAYELSTLTGTQVMLLVASETGHVYTFATRKLQPMITSEAGKALIQTCLNSPDPPQANTAAHQHDQRMSATGYEETELTYAVTEEEHKSPSGISEEYLNGSSYSGSECSSPPTPSLSPAHTPNFPISSALASCGSSSSVISSGAGPQGINPASLPVHLPAGLVLTSSVTDPRLRNGESRECLYSSSPSAATTTTTSASSAQVIQNLTSSAALATTTSLKPTTTSATHLTTLTVKKNAMSGGSVVVGNHGGSLMYSPNGNVVYSPNPGSLQDGSNPLLLNLPQGLQLTSDPGSSSGHHHQLVTLPMNLASAAVLQQSAAAVVAAAAASSASAAASAISLTDSLPTDLSLHIKRENRP